MFFGPSAAQRPVDYRSFQTTGIAAGEHTHVYSFGRGNFKILGIECIYSNSSGSWGAIPIKISWVHKKADISYWNQIGGGYLSDRNGFGLSQQPEVEGPATLRITILNSDVVAAMTTFVSYRRVD